VVAVPNATATSCPGRRAPAGAERAERLAEDYRVVPRRIGGAAHEASRRTVSAPRGRMVPARRLRSLDRSHDGGDLRAAWWRPCGVSPPAPLRCPSRNARYSGGPSRLAPVVVVDPSRVPSLGDDAAADSRVARLGSLGGEEWHGRVEGTGRGPEPTTR